MFSDRNSLQFKANQGKMKLKEYPKKGEEQVKSTEGKKNKKTHPKPVFLELSGHGSKSKSYPQRDYSF